MSVKPRSQRPARKKIFIVDDHPMMREGLARPEQFFASAFPVRKIC